MLNQKHIIIDITHPLKTWWKVGKLFRKPQANLSFKVKKHPFLFSIVSKDVEWEKEEVVVNWKSKYFTPLYKKNPYLELQLSYFLTIRIDWNMTYKFPKNLSKRNHLGNVNKYYWEYLLDYLYFRKNLDVYDIWKIEDDCGVPFVIPTQKISLTYNK
jgi:hypothetical protein